jgi:hypothetical protein
MRVYIGKYSPKRKSTLFWRTVAFVHRQFCKFVDAVCPFLGEDQPGLPTGRRVKVKVDEWDLFNADQTLAYIISATLTKFNELERDGYPKTDPLDGPAHLITDGEHSTDRWEWIVGEMAWAFEQYNICWKQQYESGEPDYVWTPLPSGGARMTTGPNHTLVIDEEGQQRHQDRIDHGIYLFGKYYRYLWS